MKFNKILPYFLLLTMVFESKAQQGISIANESEINTSFQEYSPTFYKGGLVFITSNPAVAKVKQSDDNTGKGATSIFIAKQMENGLLSKPSPFAESLTTSFYDGPLCFNPDGTVVYFTRSNLKHNKPVRAKDGLVKLKIYSAQLKADKWENIAELPFNNKEFDFTHPSVSPDGRRLYFASNRPGGFGGMDLYVVTLIENKWSEPVNLGPKINTPKDEVFPFIHADGKVYYSSNGRAKNIGGLDIYLTAKTDTGWLMPRLLPEPINSRSDDFGLILSPDKMSGYYSSNRSSGKGDDDIYSFISTQIIDNESVTNEELTNTEGVEAKSNNGAATEPVIGEVKAVEKTNAPSSTDMMASNTTLDDLKTKVETPKIEEKIVEQKIEKTIPQSLDKTQLEVEKKLEAEKQLEVEKKLEAEKQLEVEKKLEAEKQLEVEKKLEAEKKLEVEKKSEAEKNQRKAAESPVKVAEKKSAIELHKPVAEPIREAISVKEVEQSEMPAEKMTVETVVSTPKLEPVKEVLAVKEEVKSEMPAEKMTVEKVVSAPKIEPVKEVVAIKEEVKSEMPTEKPSIGIEKPVEIKESATFINIGSVSMPISDKTVENTLASNKANDVKMVVGSTVKKETLGSVRCKYLVVVGTYADEKNAKIQQKIVKNKGFADVEVIYYKDKNLYGVCVKQSNDEKEAYLVAKTVVKGGINAFVKVLK